MNDASQYALAYALTTTAGLRGFLTLLAASLAVHAGWIHPSSDYAWLGSNAATAVLAVFAVLEIIADKIPVVDHAMHALYFVLRPIAAAMLVGATVHVDNKTELYAMMAAGGLNALIVHGSSAAARAASTATTLGFGNAVLSTGEDVAAIGGIALAFFKPFVAALLCLIAVVGMILAARALTRRVRGAAPQSS